MSHIKTRVLRCHRRKCRLEVLTTRARKWRAPWVINSIAIFRVTRISPSICPTIWLAIISNLEWRASRIYKTSTGSNMEAKVDFKIAKCNFKKNSPKSILCHRVTLQTRSNYKAKINCNHRSSRISKGRRGGQTIHRICNSAQMRNNTARLIQFRHQGLIQRNQINMLKWTCNNKI